MGFFRFTPIVRLSLGLVVLTVSVLIFAQAIGLAPGVERQQLLERQNLAETLATQAALAVRRGDDQLLQELLDNAVERNEEVISAAVRRLDRSLRVQTERHLNHWSGADSQKSTPTHMRLPIMVNDMRHGIFEISFTTLGHRTNALFGLPTFIALIIFVAASTFVGFSFYIRRALQHLDPSAVVPARVRNALNILAEGVLILDKREQIVLANQTLTEQLNRSEKSLIGRKASSLGWTMEPWQPADQLPWLKVLASAEKQVGVRLLLQNAAQDEKVFLVNAVPILDGKGKSQGVIASFDDVSELEQKNQQLEQVIKQLAATQKAIENKNRELRYLASRDPLTDCFNRRSLFDFLEVNFEQARLRNTDFACIMTDIDHFKQVNDTYGHSIGDEIIKAVSATIKDVVREEDIVARFGGEEFCIVLPGAPLDQAIAIAERCRQTIAEMECEGVKVSSSFGIATLSSGAATPEALIQHADEALYHSKQNGRNRVTHWRPGMAMTA